MDRALKSDFGTFDNPAKCLFPKYNNFLRVGGFLAKINLSLYSSLGILKTHITKPATLN